MIRVFTAFAGIDFQCQALDRIKKKYPPFDYDLVGWSEIDMFVGTDIKDKADKNGQLSLF